MQRALLVVFGLAGSSLVAWAASVAADDGAAAPVAVRLGPVTGFVENRGQWDDDVAFAASASAGGQWVRVTSRGIELGSDSTRIVMSARDGATATIGVSPTGGVCNFLRGSDPRLHVVGAR